MAMQREGRQSHTVPTGLVVAAVEMGKSAHERNRK